MKKVIILFIMLFCMQQAISQECNYYEYYHLTDIAKKDFKKQDYRSSKENFQLAFSKISFPLGHDLSFAFFTAIEMNDNNWTLSIAEMLARGGVPIRYFSKFKKEKWYKILESEFDKHSIYYRENFNVEMKERFLLLVQEDKEFNDRYHEFRERKVDLTLDQLIGGATKIKEGLENFTDTYGFPFEHKMGYNYNRRLNRITPYSTNALITHIYQRGVRIFKDEIHRFVCNGGLKPIDEQTLQVINGYGNNTGIEQEMKIRYSRILKTN